MYWGLQGENIEEKDEAGPSGLCGSTEYTSDFLRSQGSRFSDKVNLPRIHVAQWQKKIGLKLPNLQLQHLFRLERC